jgi:hypothetical protein
MSGEQEQDVSQESAGCAASAALPRLPCLKKDNCIINGRYRSVFVAQENIRLYISKFGDQNVGALTVTLADCIEASEFQNKWKTHRKVRCVFCVTRMGKNGLIPDYA